MDKQINLHKKFVQAEISRISKMNGALRELESSKLARYNDEMVRDFQHERQIHLYITLFFAILAIASLAVSSTIYAQFEGDFSSDFAIYFPIILASFALSLILVVLEGFYIAYYYRLENRIAKLYPLAKEIYRL